jgi:2-polyprenyl-6-methoxyphenol hydroxylase-like FAD-dependent oxidoreductase
LAGQGVNLGFEDVSELLEIAGSTHADLGRSGLWSGYARRRRLRAQIVQTAMTGFQDVYSQDKPLFQWLRNVGVHALNVSPSLKRQIMKEALGLGAFT